MVVNPYIYLVDIYINDTVIPIGCSLHFNYITGNVEGIMDTVRQIDTSDTSISTNQYITCKLYVMNTMHVFCIDITSRFKVFMNVHNNTYNTTRTFIRTLWF